MQRGERTVDPVPRQSVVFSAEVVRIRKPRKRALITCPVTGIRLNRFREVGRVRVVGVRENRWAATAVWVGITTRPGKSYTQRPVGIGRRINQLKRLANRYKTTCRHRSPLPALPTSPGPWPRPCRPRRPPNASSHRTVFAADPSAAAEARLVPPGRSEVVGDLCGQGSPDGRLPTRIRTSLPRRRRCFPVPADSDGPSRRNKRTVRGGRDVASVLRPRSSEKKSSRPRDPGPLRFDYRRETLRARPSSPPPAPGVSRSLGRRIVSERSSPRRDADARRTADPKSFGRGRACAPPPRAWSRDSREAALSAGGWTEEESRPARVRRVRIFAVSLPAAESARDDPTGSAARHRRRDSGPPRLLPEVESFRTDRRRVYAVAAAGAGRLLFPGGGPNETTR